MLRASWWMWWSCVETFHKAVLKCDTHTEKVILGHDLSRLMGGETKEVSPRNKKDFTALAFMFMNFNSVGSK